MALNFASFKVRDLLKHRSSLKSEANGVAVIDGTQEGSYQWVRFRLKLHYCLGLFPN